MAGIGIGLSLLWTVVLALCISTMFSQFQGVTTSLTNIQVTVNAQIYATVNARNAVPTTSPTVITTPLPPTGSSTASIGR